MLEYEQRSTSKIDQSTQLFTGLINTTPGAVFDGAAVTEIKSVISDGLTTATTFIYEALEDKTLVRYGIENRIDFEEDPNADPIETNATFRPPLEDARYTLAVGESVTSSATQFSEIDNAGLIRTGDVSFSYTYLGRETVTVEGRDFNTCHFEVDTTGGNRNFVRSEWIEVGTGAPIKSEDDSTLTELISGTINGSPI